MESRNCEGRDKWIVFLLLLPFFKPEAAVQVVLLDWAYDILRILSGAVILVLYLKNRKFNLMMVLMGAFQGWILLMTLLNGGDIRTFFMMMATVLSFLMLVDLYLRKGIHPRKGIYPLITGMMLIFELLIYINLITMVIFPSGLYATGNKFIGTATENWILGFKNAQIVFFLPAMFIAIVFGFLRRKWIRPSLLILSILVSTLLAWSATTLVALSIVAVLLLAILARKLPGVFNYITYMVTSAVLFFIIVIFRKMDAFTYFFVQILRKDVLLSNRTGLWDITIGDVLQRPFFGWGYQSESVRHLQYDSATIITAHNQILEILYQGGILLLLVYIGILTLAGWRLMVLKKDKFAQVLAVIFFGLQVAQITEVFTSPLIYSLFLFAYHIGRLEECESAMEGAEVVMPQEGMNEEDGVNSGAGVNAGEGSKVEVTKPYEEKEE